MQVLQRSMRDPVFWVVIPLFMVLIPHIFRLPIWMLILVPLLFIWRLLAVSIPKLMPGKWLLLVIVIISSVGAVFHYGTLFGKTAGTAILAVLLGVKTFRKHSAP